METECNRLIIKKGAKNIIDNYNTKTGLINWAKTIDPEHAQVDKDEMITKTLVQLFLQNKKLTCTVPNTVAELLVIIGNIHMLMMIGQ